MDVYVPISIKLIFTTYSIIIVSGFCFRQNHTKMYQNHGHLLEGTQRLLLSYTKYYKVKYRNIAYRLMRNIFI